MPQTKTEKAIEAREKKTRDANKAAATTAEKTSKTKK